MANIHPSWLPLVQEALTKVDPRYLQQLAQNHWLPGSQKIFNAFSRPLDTSRYILFGESPYPRPQSANGYAFWDAAVTELWSPTGLSKAVNRATSLRNLIKMLLIAERKLSPDNTSQEAITTVDKKNYVSTITEFFGNFLDRGFVLLNATLVLSELGVQKDALAWRPFMAHLLHLLRQENLNIELILLGSIAKMIDSLPDAGAFKHFYAEHPYNISFITNPKVIQFFKPFKLLNKTS